VTSIAELDQIIAPSNDQPVLLFKHSTRCPVSATALKQLEAYCREFKHEGNLAIWAIRVIEDRNLSNWVAQHFGIQHQSPQLFLIWKGTVLWHDSHRRITKDKVAEVIEQQLVF
jgi:bacillithiol system protein YtxJ